MDIERFEALALAYGGDLRLWPEAEQGAARALRDRSPEAVRQVLQAAADLDFALDGWRQSSPSTALRERVLASAPGVGRAPRRSGPGLRFWLSGAGFAAAAAAGVIVGFTASSAAVSDVRADTLLSATLPNEIEPALNPFTVGAVGVRGA